MKTIEAVAIVTGILFLYLAWRTYIFNRALISLRNISEILPDKYKKLNWPKLSIVVPACNEEHTIENAARSLLSIDYPNLEVVFVNDRSTDRTGLIIDQIAKSDSRFKAVHITTLPEGWLGKVHAMSYGVSQVSGEYILLTDADVHFSKMALRKAISYTLQNDIDFLTVIPDLVAKTFWLQITMGQLYHVASLFFDIRKLNNPRQKVCYGQGAFLLLNKKVYEKSEKLEWLKMDVIDDSGLALVMRRAGARMAAIAGRGEVKLEWYPSLRTMVRGLEKNGFALCQYSFLVIVLLSLLTWTVGSGVLIFPFLTKSSVIILFSLMSVGTYLYNINRQLQLLMPIKVLSVLFLPLALFILPFIFIRAALLATLRKGIYWRGTFYSLSDLKINQRMKMVNLVFKEKSNADQLQALN